MFNRSGKAHLWRLYNGMPPTVTKFKFDTKTTTEINEEKKSKESCEMMKVIFTFSLLNVNKKH